MEAYSVQLLETLAILFLYVVIFIVNKNFINKALKNMQLQRARRKIIIRVLHLFTTLAAVIILAGVWGLRQSEIAVFASTIITAVGIAFFAQWSILSNITSSVILFFNHPLKLGDTIKVLDKDYPFEGEIIDLTYFFVHIKDPNGEIITIPNAMLFQKSVAIISK